MNILFFLGKRGLENYSLTRIENRKNYLLIAFVFEGETDQIPPESKACLDQIHILEKRTQGFFAEFNEDEVTQLIRDYESKFHPNKRTLLCQDEGNILIAASIRSKLNFPEGLKAEEAGVFRDKILMKEYVQKYNIRVPFYFRFDRSYSYEEISDKLGSVFIAKPISSAGSFGVYKIASEEEYKQFLKEQPKSIENYELEEFIHGKLYHCDAVIHQKKIVFIECAAGSRPQLELQSGEPLGSITISHNHPLYDQLTKFTKKCLNAFGMPDGCFHTEIFINDKQELIFLEIGARAPGLLNPKMYEKATGQNIINVDLQAQAGIRFLSQTKKTASSFWIMYPIQKGTVKKLIKPNIESEHEITWTVKEGQKTGSCKSNIDVGAFLIAWNPDEEALKQDFQKCQDHQALIYESS